MQIFVHPQKSDWVKLLARPQVDLEKLDQTVAMIFDEVRLAGDLAVSKYTKKFDGVEVDDLQVSEEEIADAKKQVPEELQKAIAVAKNNIEKFHASQLEEVKLVETVPGVTCWRESRAIERVGLYIPGGTAPLFSTVLMLAIPAKLAGCQQIALCSPVGASGKIHPAIIYAAGIAGVHSIFKIGGIQAIAAMTFGTRTVPQVDKIFGPGNQYVTAAKRFSMQKGMAIDMPAGPSEVMVLADHTADAEFVAADLLSQAEHGVDSQVVLLTFSEELATKVNLEVAAQLELLPRHAIAAEALNNSKLIVVKDSSEAIEIINFYAPEHLIINVEDEAEYLGKIINAGSVFIGGYTPESAGDYASGTNHTLPTAGYARAYSGVSLDSFIKKITFQRISAHGLRTLGPSIVLMAEAEGLQAHKNAVSIRLNKLNKNN